MQIHIFTGGKGGTGKTLMSICTALYLMNKFSKPIIFDLNIFNHDLYYIFNDLKDGTLFTEKGFNFIPLWQNSGYLVVPESSLLKNYALPSNGIASFYNSINTVIDIAKRENIATDYVLVDTTFHLANLVMPEFNGDETYWLQDGRANHLREARLLVWFLWTLASLERDAEVGAIRQVVEKLHKYHIGQFLPRRDLHHVFNPFPQLRDRNKGFSFGGLFADDFSKLIDAKVVNPIELDVMTTHVHDKLIDSRGRAIRRHTYPVQVAGEILNLGGRPANFFPIPAYDDLSGYTDLLSFAELSNLREIQAQLGEIYKLMARYLKDAP